MRDPLDELKNLTVGTSGPTLPPAEVRRRGDRMRRRRAVLQAVGAAAAVAAVAAGGAFVTGSLTTAEPPVAPAPSTSPSSTASASAAPAVESEIPEDFPIAEGIGAPENVWATELARDDDTNQAWYAVPCSGPDERVTFPGDERRTAARLVWIEGDFWGKSRQVLVYEDFAAAERAFAGLEKRLTTCAQTDETPPGAQPTTWEVESYSGNEDTPAWITAMGSASGDGSHAFFTDITATQVGRSVIVSRTGRNEQQPEPWQRLEDSHEVVLRAAWCLWMKGPCGSVTTQDPETFSKETIARGLPDPGGDVPEWTWTEGDPLSATACGGPEDLPSQPATSIRVEVSPPDENAWRHLLVFDDEKAAATALDQLRSSAVVCNELLGTSADDPTDPSEMRWTATDLPGSPDVLAIDGLAYADRTETRVPGRVLTRAVQVGKAVLVAQVSDASSGGVDDAVATNLTEDVRSIAGDLCGFADGSCEAG